MGAAVTRLVGTVTSVTWCARASAASVSSFRPCSVTSTSLVPSAGCTSGVSGSSACAVTVLAGISA